MPALTTAAPQPTSEEEKQYVASVAAAKEEASKLFTEVLDCIAVFRSATAAATAAAPSLCSAADDKLLKSIGTFCYSAAMQELGDTSFRAAGIDALLQCAVAHVTVPSVMKAVDSNLITLMTATNADQFFSPSSVQQLVRLMRASAVTPEATAAAFRIMSRMWYSATNAVQRFDDKKWRQLHEPCATGGLMTVALEVALKHTASVSVWAQFADVCSYYYHSCGLDDTTSVNSKEFDRIGLVKHMFRVVQTQPWDCSHLEHHHPFTGNRGE